MNVFDFDQTIYRGDSTVNFFFFCMRRHPRVLLYVPKITLASVRYYTLRIGTKTEFKERMYSFLQVCDAKQDVEDFWKIHLDKIKPFYHETHREDDVIISASPEFLLKPLEQHLRITVIASRVDSGSGRYDGVNCYHAEKVRRFREQYPEATIEAFYSDSYADEPLALLAQRAYLVSGDRITAWNRDRHKKRLRT